MATAYLDGSAVFGIAVRVQHVPHASAQQVSSFFGVSGTQMIFGGTRGRTFMIQGVLVGDTVADVTAAESTLLDYDDGIGRVLTDTLGRSWPAVVFTGQYQPDPTGPQVLCDGNGSWCLSYKAVFTSLL